MQFQRAIVKDIDNDKAAREVSFPGGSDINQFDRRLGAAAVAVVLVRRQRNALEDVNFVNGNEQVLTDGHDDVENAIHSID